MVRAAAGSVLKGSDGKPTVLSTAIEHVIPAVVSGLIFKNAGPLVKTISSVVGSSFAKKVFGDEGGKVVDRFKNLVSKIRNKTTQQEEPFDESGIYNSGKPSES